MVTPDKVLSIGQIEQPVCQLMTDENVWFGLVSSFSGISTFVDYFMPKPSFGKNSSDVMVIVAGNGHGDMSSNPGRD